MNMERKMVKDNQNFQMEANMLDNFKMISYQDMENIIGQMGKSIKEIGGIIK